MTEHANRFSISAKTAYWFLFSIVLAEGIPLILIVSLAYIEGLPVKFTLALYLGYSTPQLIAFGVLMAVYGDRVIEKGSISTVTKWHVIFFLFFTSQLMCVMKEQYASGGISKIDLDNDYHISSVEIKRSEETLLKLDFDGNNQVDFEELGHPSLMEVIYPAVPALILFILALVIKRDEWIESEKLHRFEVSNKQLRLSSNTV